MQKYSPPRASTDRQNLGGSGLRECKTQNPFNPSEISVNGVTWKLNLGRGTYFPYDVGYCESPMLAIYTVAINRSRPIHMGTGYWGKADVCQASGSSESNEQTSRLKLWWLTKGKVLPKYFQKDTLCEHRCDWHLLLCVRRELAFLENVSWSHSRRCAPNTSTHSSSAAPINWEVCISQRNK